MEFNEFNVLLYSRMLPNQEDTGPGKFSVVYQPPLNLANYEIALTEIHFLGQKPTPNTTLLLLCNIIDSTTIYGAHNLNLLRIWNSSCGISNFWYHRCLQNKVDRIVITALDPNLEEYDFHKHNIEMFIVLHCRKSQN